MGARRLRFVRPELGPLTIGLLVLAEGLLWLLARPTGEPGGSYFGQFLGAEAVLLLAIGLVLISTLPWVEVWFDGIDQAAIWHRRVAITGLALVLPHILLASNPARGALGGPLALIGAIGMLMLVLWAILPRWQSVVPRPLRGAVVALRAAPVVRDVRRIFGGYERWRALHRTTGVFVAAGFVHGVQIHLFLRLDLLHRLDRKIHKGVLVVAGAEVGVGFGKHDRSDAGKQARANTSTAIAVRHHEGFPEHEE